MDIGTLRGLGTLLVLLSFIGLIAWAWSGRRRADFDEAAQLPFADEPKDEPRE
jgi:cytochrome c oxidase cbb3-type subunit 4